MCDFKLSYFNVGGRAELTRLIFAKSGTKFEDERIEFADWPAKKGKVSWGSVNPSLCPLVFARSCKAAHPLIIGAWALRGPC